MSGEPGARPLGGLPGARPVGGEPGARPVGGEPEARPVGSEPGARPAGGEPEPWLRLHPLTPLLRGYKLLAVLAAVLAQEALRALDPRRTALIIVAAVPVAVISAYLSWRFTRYRVAGGDLQVESGVLRRHSRRVPLERLQAVDVVRPLVARVLGLAELRLEVVGHGQAEAPLAYLAESDAQSLRRRLLALAARAAAPAEVHQAGDAPEQVLLRVPTASLVTSVLLGAPALVGLTFVTVAAVLAAVAPRALFGLAASLLPALLGSAGVAVRRVLAEYGFTVADSPDGLRLRHGLLETRAQTIPPGRVQAVRIIEPVLWRHWRWVRVEVDVAGYQGRHGRGAREQRAQTSALLPVAPKHLANAVLGRVLDGVDLDRLATVPPPRRARWRAPLEFHNLGVGWDARHAVTTTGRLRRVTDVVPNTKVQSLRLVQGPLARRLGLASLHLDTAGRDVHAAARQRDVTEAAELLQRGVALTRAARVGG